ncbi:MAG: hypothetical protein Pars92KO_27870 [Parasphingorhabdus sp.]
MNKVGLATIIVTTVVLGIFFWANRSTLNSTEKALFDRIDEVIDQEPQASEIAPSFSLPEKCGKEGCFFDEVQVNNLSNSGGKLHPTPKGLVFELEGLGPQCVRTAQIQKQFGLGQVGDSCSHGPCWYLTIQKDWGHLSFALENPTARCASTFVINSLPHMRRTKKP